MVQDTIAAISTGMINSGIGIIRMSGNQSFEIINKIYKSKSGKKKLDSVKSHTIHYGYITEKEEVVDEVLVMVMKGPNTFTTEDVIEINCHGGILVMKKILELLIKNGARCAQAGEFTKRAFLNGRLDLSQAEAVIDIINSKNDYALKSSISQLKGTVLKKIKDIRSKIIYEVAFIESALDDPEHINIDGYKDKLLSVVSKLEEELGGLVSSFENGKIIREGIKAVIVGKPNAGKSSILNLLVKDEKAIVTNIAGTTRDVLEEQINLSGIGLNIVDTAGIRDTDNVVEQIGVKRAKEYAKDADLIIYVVDSSMDLDKNDKEIIKMIKNKKVIVLLNKSDLDTIITEDILKNKLECKVISISAKENKGIDELENNIKEMFYQGNISFNDQVYITNVRHKTALNVALESLLMVKNGILDDVPEDFLTIDLVSTYEELGKITGEAMGEDLVNEIFSKFCTGK
jgi:tRNA modification GTPase TrmE